MHPPFGLDLEELNSFTVPHVLRLVGENQHLIGAGSIVCAVNQRLRIDVEETPDEFQLTFVGLDRSGEVVTGGPDVEGWRRALGELVLPDPELLEGLSIRVDFASECRVPMAPSGPPSPSLAAALTMAVASHRAENRVGSDQDAAEIASCVCHAIAPGPMGDTGRYYGEALAGLTGGAIFAELGGERLNVQSLLPTDSLLVAIRPELAGARGEKEREGAILRALAITQQEGANIMAAGGKGLEALFGIGEGLLDQDQVTMLYGLLRIREMLNEFLEFLAGGTADNDRLAEICDEESAILKDYFGFPADAYDDVVERAGEGGALGAKLTWAFGGHPVALLIAPGRRGEVAEALSTVKGVEVVPVDIEFAGLLPCDD